MDFLEKYDIYIKNKDMLLRALTHSSYSNEHNVENYERLEFLGDAVLEILMSDYLYNNMSLSEGEMTKMRATYVCESACKVYADEINFYPFIRVGHGQANNVSDAIIADMFEAVMGCIYLELGLDGARKLFDSVVIPNVLHHNASFKDYKSRLQELVQTSKKSLEYRLVKESGPAHDRVFEVEVVIDDMIYGRGTGKSKKEAEQNAAKDAYDKQAKVV